MNFAAVREVGLDGDGEVTRQRRNRFVMGMAVSLALHAMLLSSWHIRSHSPENVSHQPRSIAVWLRPKPPVIVPEEEKTKPQARRSESPVTAPRKERRIIAVPKSPPSSPEEPVLVEETQAQPVGQESPSRFNHDAAIGMARRIASEELAAAPEKAYRSESKLARGISAAKRRDCKDGLPGGLLGPVLLLLDKKDHGCKW